MAPDHRVNSDNQNTPATQEEDSPERPRWWLLRPGFGVIASALLGVGTLVVTLSIGRPDNAPGPTFTNIIILPIALLLPAIAASGVFVAWQAFQATRGALRSLLTLPCALAIALNAAAVILFLRWVWQLFSG